MGDELDNKIKQLSSILNDSNMQSKVKDLLANFVSNSKENPPSSSNAETVKLSESASSNNLGESLESLYKIKSLMDRIKTLEDPRINLINAIKPFISSVSEKNLTQCIKIIQLSNFIKIMGEQENR